MSTECTYVTAKKTADELWSEIQQKHPYPLSLQLVLTYRCGLSCGHCYVVPPTKEEHLLTLQTYIRCFDDWVDMGVLQLTFTGGEPGLRPDLIDLIAEAGKRHFLTNLKTAAGWMTPNTPNQLRDAGLSVLEVSLYAPEAKLHDRFVGRSGAFDRAFVAATAFHALGGRVRINITAMNWNAQFLPELIRKCEDAGFDPIMDAMIATRQNGDTAPSCYRMSEEQLYRLADQVTNNDRSRVQNLPPKSRFAPICGAGRGSAQIEPNGDVRLCDRLRPVLGNICRQSLQEIWDASKFRKKIIAMRWEELSPCATCPNASACAHCPGESLASLGDLTAANPYECMITRAMLGYR